MSPDQPVNENQHIDIDRIRQHLTESKAVNPMIEELLDLVSGSDLLTDVQRAREDMIVEDMMSQAGMLQPPNETLP